MAATGFVINAISVEGPGKANATLQFAAGLNVVVGASNTGKTYVFQIIDFLLGSSRLPKPVPEAAGYAEAYLQLTSKVGDVTTFRRSLQGGDVQSYKFSIESIGDDATPVTLASKHEKGNVDTVSGRLLTLAGLFGRELRVNAQGEKRSLSFRDIASLSLVDEERIISDRSPALSGQVIHDTVEKNVLGLFLTGVDDTSVIVQEKPKDRKARIKSELDLLAKLLADRDERLLTLGVDVAEIENQRARVRQSIEDTSNLISATQLELDSAASIRDEAWSSLQNAASRRRFLSEQMKRFRLLREHYNSDSSRLASSLEAGIAFEQLPTGECPVCGSTGTAEEVTGDTVARLSEFQSACQAELSKIGALLRDLEKSESELQDEDRDLANKSREYESSVKDANATIGELFERKRQVADQDLSQLLALDERLSHASLLASEIQDLAQRQEAATQMLTEKVPKLKLADKVETSTAAKFCEVMANTLKAWKFPFEGHVSFDSKRFDVVIGDQNRGSFGKGYRAVTHAAFVVSLMRYCRSEGLPHPGIVVLDTPLNPFKGPDKDSPDRINHDVQEAFYADLAADVSGDQFIIFENTEPSALLKAKISYSHFSGNPASGRVGFFGALG